MAAASKLWVPLIHKYYSFIFFPWHSKFEQDNTFSFCPFLLRFTENKAFWDMWFLFLNSFINIVFSSWKLKANYRDFKLSKHIYSVKWFIHVCWPGQQDKLVRIEIAFHFSTSSRSFTFTFSISSTALFILL